MEPPQDQPSNNGQMDKVVKEETDNQNGESRQPPDLQTVAEEEEPHETHSIVWRWKDKLTSMTCTKARTIESLLNESTQFSEIASKNKNKELVIVRHGKAISSHFPCSLIKNEQLDIKYVKAVDEPKQSGSGRMGPSSELVMFHLLTRGGTNLQNAIIRNQALKNDFDEITVYAYKGEKVKHALKGDGRLHTTVFEKTCALSNMSTKVTTEMSDLVDDLHGKTFKIILLNRSSPPDSQPGSLDDAPPEQSSTTESGNVSTPKKTAGLDGKKAPDFLSREITDSEKMRSDLLSEFQDFVKRKIIQVSGLPPIKHLRVEYGKNTQTCLEVKTMKKLGELSNSVCSVRVNGRPEGSGFLLFDQFVLTNAHVLKNIYDESTGQLNKKLTVDFSYESVGQMESGVEVEEVAGFEYCHDASGHKHDWALLKIGADQKSTDVLLKHFGFLPQSGGICIIGHPDDSPKKADPCFIVPTKNREQVVEKHRSENPQGVVPNNLKQSNQDPIQLVTHRFFEDVKNDEENSQALTYETCLHFGSSGSPVFDMHCKVVAMHSGGYAYKNASGKSHSVIEFGYPLSIIIERIIVQMVTRCRFDVFKSYLACSYRHQQRVMDNVKKLPESKNIRAFVATHPEVTNDESLKTFFEFMSQIEDPVSMDCD